MLRALKWMCLFDNRTANSVHSVKLETADSNREEAISITCHILCEIPTSMMVKRRFAFTVTLCESSYNLLQLVPIISVYPKPHACEV